MIIAYRSVEIFIENSHSLKEKRQVLRRIKDTIKSRFNVSFAEIDFQDKWQRSRLGFVTIAAKRADVDKRLDTIQKLIEEDDRLAILDIEREYL
ncbi:MAG TPA: DUF503 domain-containing protein [candidate division Zixibacteria bacterium]|nr:DUF503 domain-containing protein [candidate division Zixibacteria bacterium]